MKPHFRYHPRFDMWFIARDKTPPYNMDLVNCGLSVMDAWRNYTESQR